MIGCLVLGQLYQEREIKHIGKITYEIETRAATPGIGEIYLKFNFQVYAKLKLLKEFEPSYASFFLQNYLRVQIWRINGMSEKIIFWFDF
jgi:hypothetical protein